MLTYLLQRSDPVLLSTLEYKFNQMPFIKGCWKVVLVLLMNKMANRTKPD